MGRKLVFTPLVEDCRAKFVNSWHITALKVLAELDRCIHSRPEAGTATSKRGRFAQSIAVTVSAKTFLCRVAYSYTDHAIRIEAFTWEVLSTVTADS